MLLILVFLKRHNCQLQLLWAHNKDLEYAALIIVKKAPDQNLRAKKNKISLIMYQQKTANNKLKEYFKLL